jgi:uncharacterized SAM-binding protein YcdF (DUF218 family)
VSLLRRHPIISALAILVLVALVLVVVTGVAVWSAAHVDAASRVERADAIVVLGAAEYDGRPSPVFAGRLEHAVLLFNEGRASTVLVLGGSRPGDVSTEADAGATYLVSAGLPSSDVVPIPHGSNTLESLRAAAAYMRAHGLRSAFLVSDPWHNLRIQRMASDLGISGYPSATWHSAARSEGTRLDGYIRETFAYLYYRLLGR